MPVTAKDAACAALKLCGHVNSMGTVDDNRESKYIGLAPAYLTILVREIGEAENSASAAGPVTDMNSVLSVSDDSAVRVLPFGLAMYFALIDRDSELYNYFSELYYEKLLPSIRPDETAIQDYYGVLGDSSLMKA